MVHRGACHGKTRFSGMITLPRSRLSQITLAPRHTHTRIWTCAQHPAPPRTYSRSRLMQEALPPGVDTLGGEHRRTRRMILCARAALAAVGRPRRDPASEAVRTAPQTQHAPPPPLDRALAAGGRLGGGGGARDRGGPLRPPDVPPNTGSGGREAEGGVPLARRLLARARRRQRSPPHMVRAAQTTQ